MINKKLNKNNKDTFSKRIIKEITPILANALIKLKGELGDKKFEKRIKKAAKVMAHGIKEKPVKKAVPVKKILVKAIKHTGKPATTKKALKSGSKK